MAVSSQEIGEFNLKRQAIQNTVTWEFEMWRRQTQAAWEIEQQERESEYKKQLETELQGKKQNIDDKKMKEMLQAKQKALQDLLIKCQNETKILQKLKDQLQQEQKQAQLEYGKQCQTIQLKYKNNRNSMLAKTTAMKAKQEEMQQRSQFFKDQWAAAEERLRQDQQVMDERKRNLLAVSEEDLLGQMNDLQKAAANQQTQKQYLERCKQELYQQYQRAVLLCQELKQQQIVEEQGLQVDESEHSQQ